MSTAKCLTTPEKAWASKIGKRRSVVTGRAVQFKLSGPNKGRKLTCDEYPFASTQQSSPAAWIGCIIDFQNTAGGSKYLRPFYSNELKYQAGCPFVMQIDPTYDCTTVSQSSIPGCTRNMPRQEAVTAAANGVFYDPDENSPGMLIIPLGDIPAGSYSVEVTFPPEAIVTSVYIGDDLGEQYNIQELPTSGSTYQFTAVLDDTGYAAALIAETTYTATDLSVVSWSVQSSGEDTPPFSTGGTNSATVPPSSSTSYAQTPTGTITIVTVISGVTITTTTCPEEGTSISLLPSSLPPPPPPAGTSTIVTVISGVTITTTTCPEEPTSSSLLPPQPPPESPGTELSPPPVASSPLSVSLQTPSASQPQEEPTPGESNPEGQTSLPPPPLAATTPTTSSTTTTKTAPTSLPAVVVTSADTKPETSAIRVIWTVLGMSLLFYNL
ncbi:hypothetical protein SPI_07799 [Niveomyces insectorum RCEF 264]|uniref:Deoxyribonuclease NucA/NucB domain-containing protein n=1 Tax=Niveomyces insectorum RCEF 264 TaxID=1081102 RepID=A0A167P1H9_9HYPO|nr:hypothetical protein SPI_07799 [Niveomyces insectorum RCEF 264]